MSFLRTASIVAGTVLVAGIVGIGSYTALGGKMPGAKSCPGGITGASIGAPFELTGADGSRIGTKDLAGKPTLLYFGFTTCPDVCPMELAEVGEAVDILAAEHDLDVQSVFITIDPERDTEDKVGEYAAFFHEDMIGLTGTPEEIDATARKGFRVYYGRVSDPDFQDGYTMDHSNIIYLLDREANYRTFFRGGEATPQSIAEGTACHMG